MKNEKMDMEFNPPQHEPTKIFKVYKKPLTRSISLQEDSSTIYQVIESTPKHLKAYETIKIDDTIGGRYHVLNIDQREICSIYICQDMEAQEIVVLKTLKDELLSSNELENRFKEEALIAISLEDHPNIVKVLRFKYIKNRPFLILEYIKPDEFNRNTLNQYLKDFLPFKRALKWAAQFCAGMEHVNKNNINAHRDIKPENIMITADKNLKITDFGFANLETETESYICGTPPWMAPEQFQGKSDIRSDIYSFGIVLYQMANGGELPFHAEGNDPNEQIKNWYNVQKTKTVPYITNRLFPIIQKCLQKDPNNRYLNFTHLKEDLEKLDAMEHYYDGLCFAEFGLNDKAVEQFRKAIKLKPDYLEARISLDTLMKDFKFQ